MRPGLRAYALRAVIPVAAAPVLVAASGIGFPAYAGDPRSGGEGTGTSQTTPPDEWNPT